MAVLRLLCPLPSLLKITVLRLRLLSLMLMLATALIPLPSVAQADAGPNLDEKLQGKLMLAAAASVKPVMEALIQTFQQRHPALQLIASYGSSGKISTQISNGAPFDLFLSADMTYPQWLVSQGLTAGAARVYARGRLVLWQRGAMTPSFEDLRHGNAARVAIANPRHAPYGQRAQEVLVSQDLWEPLQGRLVFGENIAQTAQFLYSGAADTGLIALSLALNPALAAEGRYTVVDEQLHQPLDHGYIVTRGGAANPAARAFGEFILSDQAGIVLRQHGFEVPAEP